MAADSSKPSVLIFGGLNTCSRALAAFLVPIDGEPLVAYLRIVDKYSVHPATTYIGPDFAQVLKKPEVEYRQANLTVAATIESAFAPPEDKSDFDYVFDFTGEVRSDRGEMIQIGNTFAVARLLGLEAAKRKVKAFVRIQQPFYETSSKHPASEKEDIKPVETMGIWWHETLRTLASIENLNLVILRIGFVYGPYVDFGNIISAITVASVYGYLQKPMKSMWSPGKNPTNTVHIDDVAGGAWACAKWIANVGRKAANEAAGVPIPFHNDKSKVSEVEGIIPYDQKPAAPVFNLVDDSKTTLVSTGKTVSSFFGTTFEFFNVIETTVFKLMDDLEDINEHHVEGWTEMLVKSDPPITNTPISAYMDKYTLEKHVVGFDNSKIKELVGYKLLRPEFNHENIKEIVDKWKDQKLWPNVVKA
ncbi:NAD(P)-binding protein [Pholiota conissans]|uniref:NAD(P)-binding protein n=1 Tax=Pholiota conissans TaxID=109636 RepID=A0A9P6CL41_9AGAR|nr:NAD(P)-binding protein [Pholiota conissans]